MQQVNDGYKYPFFARSAEEERGQHELSATVVDHFEKRKKVWPTVQDALLFTMSELAEAIELVLARTPYRRRHPEEKEPFSTERFSEELGDVIYMAIIAGEVEGVDPITALIKKMNQDE